MNSCDEDASEEAGAKSTSAQNERHRRNDAGFGVIAEAVAIFYDSSGALFHVFQLGRAQSCGM